MNVPMRLVTTVVLTLSLFGCVTGEKMSSLHPGMTKAEVVSVLGKPDGYKQIAGYEIYRYSNRLSSGWSWDRADYNVVFKNDRVVEYGAGEVRPRSNGAVVIVPVGLCQDNHGKHRWSEKNDPALPPTDASAIQAVTPSDIFNWQGPTEQ